MPLSYGIVLARGELRNGIQQSLRIGGFVEEILRAPTRCDGAVFTFDIVAENHLGWFRRRVNVVRKAT